MRFSKQLLGCGRALLSLYLGFVCFVSESSAGQCLPLGAWWHREECEVLDRHTVVG